MTRQLLFDEIEITSFLSMKIKFTDKAQTTFTKRDRYNS